MTRSTGPVRVAVYCRISNDRDGQGLGVERQRQDCLARVERENWTLVDVMIDNDIGASIRTKRTVRPAYRALLQLAEDRKIDVILSYSNSRLTRRLRELEDLIQLHERTGVHIRTIVSGDDNLSTADGRMTARIKASVDVNESERIGERVARKAKERREQGKHHGGFPPFGYDRANEGKLSIHQDRAAVVREAAGRVLAGESIYGIWTDFNRRGLKTAPGPRAPHGARWQSRTLRRILTAPATIGCHLLDNGELRQVADPVLDRPTWDRLREILHDPRRQTGAPPDWSTRRKFPLSGLMYCGVCGHHLSGAALQGQPGPGGKKKPVTSFACVTATGGCGRIRINYAPVEAWVVNQVCARLDGPAVRDALSTREEPGDDNQLRQQIADAERRLEGLDDDHADGVLDDRRYRRQVARLTEQLDTMRGELAETQRSTFVIETSGRSLRDVWTEHDATWQRTLLGHVIDRVVIEPHPAGVATRLTQKREEDDAAIENRRATHLERILLQRVHVEWSA